MSLIYSTLDNPHQIRHSIRQREITEASQMLASGNRLSTNNNKDSGALRISSHLKSLSAIGDIAKRSLNNAYHLIQYQSDILYYAENTISRMNEIAHQATDTKLNKHERRNLVEEFQSHIGTLKDILYDRTFGKIMFDPLEYQNIVSLNIEGHSGGATISIKEIEYFGSLGGKIQLWWQPYIARDRIQIFQGESCFFDSEEYASAHDINQNGYYDIPGIEYRALDAIRTEDGSPVFGDRFEIDFQTNQITVTYDPGNIGNPEEYLGLSDSIQHDNGCTYIRTESLFSHENRLNETTAQSKPKDKLDSISIQISTLTKVFSELRFRRDRTEIKTTVSHSALSKTSDTYKVQEATKLAKNLSVQRISNNGTIQKYQLNMYLSY